MTWTFLSESRPSIKSLAPPSEASHRLETPMRTASLCLLAVLLAACSSTTSPSRDTGTTSADAATVVDAPEADQASGGTGTGSSRWKPSS